MLSKKHILLVFFILLNVCCANDKIIITEKDTIVAKIGEDYNVTFKDLSKYVSDWQYDIKYRIHGGIKVASKVGLNALIRDQMKRFDFFDRRLYENKNLMRSMNRIINEELSVEYFIRLFKSTYITEKKALETYKLMGKEVVYYQIVLPLHGDEKERTLDSLKAIALKIQNDFVKTKDIEKYLKKYSAKNGKLDNPKKVTWEQSISDPVGDVVFNLSKGFTRIIKSVDGYYIVIVTDIKKIDLEPFEKMKNNIMTKLREVYFTIFEDEFVKKKQEYVDESKVKWNDNSITKITEWSNIPRFYQDSYQDTIQNVIKRNGNFEILSYNKGSVDLNEFLRFLDEVEIMKPLGKMDKENVKNFIMEAIRTDYIIKEAKKVVDQKEIFNPYTKNDILKFQIVQEYNNELIENQIPEITEASLHKFYDEHRDSIFYQLKVVNILARIYTDSIKAAEEMKEIKKGIPFEKISNTWYNKGFVRKKDGKLKSYFSPEPPYLAEAAFKLELNGVAGPIEYSDTANVKNYAVIKCDEIIPEKQLTYEDVKKNIKEEFKNYYRNKIANEVDLRLNKKYKVEIFGNVLENALSAK